MREPIVLLAIMLCGCTSQQSEERIPITAEVEEQIESELSNIGCDDSYVEITGGEFDNSLPSESVTYHSDAYAFSVNVPFNPSWGTPRFAALPYSEEGVQNATQEKHIGFGPIGFAAGPTCDRLGRQYEIRIMEKASIEELLVRAHADTTDAFGSDVPEEYLPYSIMMQHHEAVVSSPMGLCSSFEVAVPGPLYTYLFRSTCGSGTQEEIDFLVDVADSMMFYDAASTAWRDYDCAQLPQPERANARVRVQEEWDISFEVPYNAQWIDWEQKIVTAYERSMGGSTFGPLRYAYNPIRTVFHAGDTPCTPVRDFLVTGEGSAKGIDTLLQREKELAEEYKLGMTDEIAIKRIGSMDVVVVPAPNAVCPRPKIVVPGKEYDYMFSLSCEALLHYDDPLTELEDIVATIQWK